MNLTHMQEELVVWVLHVNVFQWFPY